MGQQSTNTLSSVVDLLVEHRVKLDALEHVLVLKETNPLAHELYLGTIENLQAQKQTAEVNRLLSRTANVLYHCRSSAGSRCFSHTIRSRVSDR